MKLVTAEEMQRMDKRTIEEFGTPGIILMENAALRVVEAIVHRYSPLAGKKITVVCGKGNNGGDGLAIARHLSCRYSANVTIVSIAETGDLKGDAALNLMVSRRYNLPLLEFREGADAVLEQELSSSDLIIDAMLGTGIHGPVTGKAATAIEAINKSGKIVIAVDIPSGVDANTGAVQGPAVKADLTVTFALGKLGLYLYPGAEYAGEIVVGDICMPLPVIEESVPSAIVTERGDAAAVLPSREENRDANKGKYGHTVIFAGSYGFMGAAALSALAAARTGAGLVTLAVPEGMLQAAMSSVNPVIMTKGLPQTPSGAFSKAALENALSLIKKASACAIGPGIGGVDTKETSDFVLELIRQCEKPLVIDADALNILASLGDHGMEIISKREAPTVMTPHPGEMSRLLDISTADIQNDRLNAIMKAVKQYKCVFLLKGSHTLIASADGRLNINTTGNSGMATGGAGDVLTGLITALLGNSVPDFEAATAGAYIHGLAGDMAAEHFNSKAGLIAEDIANSIPLAIGKCLIRCL